MCYGLKARGCSFFKGLDGSRPPGVFAVVAVRFIKRSALMSGALRTLEQACTIIFLATLSFLNLVDSDEKVHFADVGEPIV
jgi:hypothetical protein